jgi:D-glycero-alpha-D-manno-heptose 1-phosphate guanylyltransferase
MIINECIILAGGFGTRLRSAVPDLPKCMAPVAGQPFIAHVINHFQQQGIIRFIMSLGYKHEVIRQYIESQYPALDIQYSIEDEPLGTGGAIRLACRQATQKNVLVVNGDTFFPVSVDKLAFFHDQRDADCTLALKPLQNFDRYGVVELEPNGAIRTFREKQYYAEGFINAGVYTLQVKSFLSDILPEKFSFEKDYLEKFYEIRRMYGLVQDEYFIDIGIPEDYEKANIELAHLKI